MMSALKVCFRCNEKKPLSEFYKHKGMSDGHLNKCKDCTRMDSHKREIMLRSTPEGVESERARHREKYHRLNYKGKQMEWNKDKPWKKKTGYKNTRRDIEAFLKKNHLVNIDNCELHHWSYSDENIQNVLLVSKSTHAKWHRRIKLDTDILCYRLVKSDVILDSVHKHATELCKFAKESLIINIFKDNGEWKVCSITP